MVCPGADNEQIVGDIQVAGGREIFVGTDDRESEEIGAQIREQVGAEDDDIWASEGVGLDDRRAERGVAGGIFGQSVAGNSVDRVVERIDVEPVGAMLDCSDVNLNVSVELAVEDSRGTTLVGRGGEAVVPRIQGRAAGQQGVGLVEPPLSASVSSRGVMGEAGVPTRSPASCVKGKSPSLPIRLWPSETM